MRTFNLTLFALIFIFSAAASAQEVYLAESHGRPSYKQELAYEKARVDDFYRLLEEKKKEKARLPLEESLKYATAIGLALRGIKYEN